MPDLIPLPPPAPLAPAETPDPLAALIAAWLETKARRTNSERTRRAYADAIAGFRAALAAVGADLDGEPRLIALAAEGWATGGRVAPATSNQRLAILSSFYTFARRHGSLTENPIARVERRPVQRYGSSKALPLEHVRSALAALDRSTPQGQRDYCLLAVGLQTGRRVAELASLRWGDVEVSGGSITLTFRRCKGGKTMRDALPAGLSRELAAYLRAVYGERLRGLDRDAAVWVSFSPQNAGQAVGVDTVRDVCERILGTTKVHALRHTFARALEEAGAKLSDIQARLGHESAATTGVYVAALRRAENPHADALAALLGL